MLPIKELEPSMSKNSFFSFDQNWFMKNTLLFTSVFFAVSFFAACSKEDQPPVRSIPPLPRASFSGTEVQFDSLAWQDEDFISNVFISIDNRPDIFLYSMVEEVFLKADTSSVWKLVNPSAGFTYSINAGRFFIAPDPPDMSFSGRSASVKIKFR